MPKAKKVKEPPVLFDATQALITKLQNAFDAPLICYWNNPRGSVCSSDVVALYKQLSVIGKQKELYLFLKSDGGRGTASLRFVSLLH